MIKVKAKDLLKGDMIHGLTINEIFILPATETFKEGIQASYIREDGLQGGFRCDSEKEFEVFRI